LDAKNKNFEIKYVDIENPDTGSEEMPSKKGWKKPLMA
jgi:disulfide oxidoreductase YuzD